MTTRTYAEIVGTERQVKWAVTIREQALREEGWTDEQLTTLHRVSDATWWIANRHDFPHLSFKIPLPKQLEGGAQPVQIAGQNAHARQMDLAENNNEMGDAVAFAASISTKPKLAQITVLALLARLYKPSSKQRETLRAVANELLRQGDYPQDEKDLDAINRILRPL